MHLILIRLKKLSFILSNKKSIKLMVLRDIDIQRIFWFHFSIYCILPTDLYMCTSVFCTQRTFNNFDRSGQNEKVIQIKLSDTEWHRNQC